MREIGMLRHRADFVLQHAGPGRIELELVTAYAAGIDGARNERLDQHGAAVDVVDAAVRAPALKVSTHGLDELRAEHTVYAAFDPHVGRRQAVQRNVDG